MCKVNERDNIYGQMIGILMLEWDIPRIPGDIGNATTFSFPINYKIVTIPNINTLADGDPKLLPSFLKAAQELEKEGVGAITTGCGFLGIFQEEISNAVSIPFFSSSLIQVPFVYRMLGKGRKVGIMTAWKEKITPRALRAVGIGESIPVCIVGMEDADEFSNVIIKRERSVLDVEKLKVEMIDAARQLVKENPSVGAIVFECTNMPPYAAAIQKEVRLPVFDIVTLTNMVYNGLVREEFTGLVPISF